MRARLTDLVPHVDKAAKVRRDELGGGFGPGLRAHLRGPNASKQIKLHQRQLPRHLSEEEEEREI